MVEQEVAHLFTHPSYLVRKKFWKVFGAAFHIYDPEGQLAFYSKQKAFKLREDIRLFTDESMTTEVLTIKARSIIDFSAAYDVVDTASGQKVGALKRKGFTSIFRDNWILMDADDNEIGKAKEDSMLLATIRRWFINLIPQKYHVTAEDGAPLAKFKQRFNPFVQKMDIDFTADTDGRLDRRLGLAAAVLLVAIEGRQGQNS
ncbi:MAG: LURP-one-related/scramblase family protein [Planctomycetota bacterium]|jgi:hypothetical protein